MTFLNCAAGVSGSSTTHFGGFISPLEELLLRLWVRRKQLSFHFFPWVNCKLCMVWGKQGTRSQKLHSIEENVIINECYVPYTAQHCSALSTAGRATAKWRWWCECQPPAAPGPGFRHYSGDPDQGHRRHSGGHSGGHWSAQGAEDSSCDL